MLHWIEDTSGAGNILWVHGPLCSPSIAQAVAEQQARECISLATYFFDRRPTNNKTCTEFIATIAYQLGVASPPAREYIARCVAQDPAVLSQCPSNQLNTLILQSIATILSEATNTRTSHSNHVMIIVYGCEYLGRGERTRIIDMLTICARQFPLHVRIILFTRTSAGFTQSLNPLIQQGAAAEVFCARQSRSRSHPTTYQPEALIEPFEHFHHGWTNFLWAMAKKVF